LVFTFLEFDFEVLKLQKFARQGLDVAYVWFGNLVRSGLNLARQGLENRLGCVRACTLLLNEESLERSLRG
jgi:hypothetical protein